MITDRPRLVSTRRVLIAASCLAALAILLAAGDSAQAGSAEGPDVTVFAFTDILTYPLDTGRVVYAIGTNACNRGDAPLNWCEAGESGFCAPAAGSEDHPVIAQNLYRLKNGRFEQIGMSWVKHSFAALNASSAGCEGVGACQPPPAGTSQLGVGCIDPHSGSTNGTRAFMGPRSDVNAATGVFPYPPWFPPGPYATRDQRIQVSAVELTPELNVGASYWAEGHYVASDDASASNAFNNASYQRVAVGPSPDYPLTMIESFVEGKPAIFAWQAQDASVELVEVDVPGALVERFHVARKVTDLDNGTWHYEYAIHNLNSDRSAGAFSVQFPGTTVFTGVGFDDIEYHSGELYAPGWWSVSTSSDLVSWSTTPFAGNPNANALRFATLFNFWFDADAPPAGLLHTLELFKPGSPASVQFGIEEGIFSDGFESGASGAWGAVQ